MRITDNQVFNEVNNVINTYCETFTAEDLFLLDCLYTIFNDADFERKHPRDEKGRFTSSGRHSASYIDIFQALEKNNLRDYSTDEIIQRAVKTYGADYPEMTEENIKRAISKADKYNEQIKENKTDTQNLYSKFDTKNNERVYTEERAQKHEKILNKIFANKKLAKPKDGEKPTVIFLGGRGGSGKSKFDLPDEKHQSNLGVYDRSKYIVLDADAIKEELDEYKGYNAYEVHEESSDILNKALRKAQEEGLNVVLDATMKTVKSTEKKVKSFADADYNIEMYYMHLPREKATERAIHRFMTGGKKDEEGNVIKQGRYVPLNVILEEMKYNEETFDKLKKYASKWAFYNNDVPSIKDKPILIDKNY